MTPKRDMGRLVPHEHTVVVGGGPFVQQPGRQPRGQRSRHRHGQRIARLSLHQTYAHGIPIHVGDPQTDHIACPQPARQRQQGDRRVPRRHRPRGARLQQAAVLVVGQRSRDRVGPAYAGQADRVRQVIPPEPSELCFVKLGSAFGGGAVFLDCDPRRRRPWRSTRGNSGNARSSCM